MSLLLKLSAVLRRTGLGAALLLPVVASRGVEINRVEPVNARPLIAPLTFDSELASAELRDGSLWAVWQAYEAGREQIVGRVARDAVRDGLVEVSTRGAARSHPEVIARDAGAADFFWSACDEGRWRIMHRAVRDGKWSAENALSPIGSNAFQPVATSVGGDVAVAWTEHRDGRFAIGLRILRGGVWSEARTLSDPGADAFRPALAATATGELWLFWDTYVDGEYRVQGRSVVPEVGPIEQVSPANTKCLAPTAKATARLGVCVAWVKVTDVIGGEGVIDQTHRLQMAVRRGGRWLPVRDPGGSDEAASLDHGFLAKMDPKPSWSGGYLGERRKPLLAEEDGAVWLLWERKTDHTASTPNAPGELLGRKFSGDVWEPARRLHRGHVEYALPGEAHVREGVLTLTAASLPRERRRLYQSTRVDLRGGEPVTLETWTGWRPISLPLRPAPTNRPAVSINGKTYQLFWVDSHVHSNLSADAEGEPDEVIHFARDKARLDAVVVQENDVLYDMVLTESEYALGTFFARAYSRPGEFLVLPGFEWTQILPLGEGDPARPAFWKGSFRNHRTVIYPLSGGPLVRYTEAANDARKLYAAVAAHGGVTHTQHQTFDLNGHAVETAVEVTAGWGIYFLNTARIHAALNDGSRIGFVGVSDSHRRTPGLGGGVTGVYAEELSDHALLAAYRERRLFATTGTRMAIEAWANGVFMGQEAVVPAGEPVRLKLRVQAPKPLRRIVLVRAGTELKTFAGPAGGKAEIDFTDTDVTPGRHWYYWRVETEGSNLEYPGNLALAEGNLGWSSPVWVQRR